MKFALVIVDIQKHYHISSVPLVPLIKSAVEAYAFDHITSIFDMPPEIAFDIKNRKARRAFIKEQGYPETLKTAHFKMVKPQFSALEKTHFKRFLRSKQPENIIVCGIYGHCCVRATLIDLAQQFPTTNIIFAKDLCEGDLYETESVVSRRFDLSKLSKVHSLSISEVHSRFGLPLKKSPTSSATRTEISSTTHSSANSRTIKIST
jgi:hypothetical protein